MSHEPARKVTCVKPDPSSHQYRTIGSVAEGIEPLFQRRYLRRSETRPVAPAVPGDASPPGPDGV